MKTTVTSRGQTSIPARIRKELEITEGTVLDWEIEEGRIVVYPVPQDPFRQLRGIARHLGPSVADLLAQRRQDRDTRDEDLRS